MKSLALLVLLVPAVALASDCEHAQPRTLSLDLDGVRAVRIEVNANQLRLAPVRSGTPTFSARACASDPAYFDQLKLTQARDGDVLVVRAERDGYSKGVFFKASYAYLELDAQLPPGLAYEVVVGSGDTWISGMPEVRLEVGSGDAEVRGATGTLTAKIGSGDLKGFDIGRLEVVSVGSGDLEVRGMRGDASIGDIGSGDVDLHTIGGNLGIESIGSGDLTVVGVDGGVAIGRIGSGDADITDVGDGLTVRRIGSGDVRHREVRGPVDLPSDD